MSRQPIFRPEEPLMADAHKPVFAAFAAPSKGYLVLFCEEGVKFGPAARKALAPTGDLVERAAAADKFTGKSGTALDIVAPAGLPVRAAVAGPGELDQANPARGSRALEPGEGDRGPRRPVVEDERRAVGRAGREDLEPAPVRQADRPESVVHPHTSCAPRCRSRGWPDPTG